MEVQLSLFDYNSLDTDTRTFVQEKAQAIHTRLKRTAEDIIAIGEDLIAVKARLGHGQFTPWLQTEFEMTDRHARNFMNVAARFSRKTEIISDLPVTVIYELAAPSTPDTVIEMVAAGEIAPTLPAIREVKQEIAAAPPAPTGHLMQIMSSSETPEWCTPQDIIEHVLRMFGEIDTDPCSNSHDNPNVPAKTLYTKEDDGLSKNWHGRVYMNPPYGTEIGKWIDKLLAEHNAGVSESISLLPARVDTSWFQPLYEHTLCMVRGRLQFSNAQYSAPFPSVIVYIGNRQQEFINVFEHMGNIIGGRAPEQVDTQPVALALPVEGSATVITSICPHCKQAIPHA